MATTTFTTIPISQADLVGPCRGAEDWHRQQIADIPAVGSRQTPPANYRRFGWPQLEGSTEGSFNFSLLDSEINACIDQRQQFGFGMFCVSPGGADSYNGRIDYDGAPSLYPLYLHRRMQTESVRDRIIGGTWVPNWNSAYFLSRLDALNVAVNNHLDNTSYKGVRYRDVISYIDIRVYGSWGEWHNGGLVNDTSELGALFPTVATFKRIIDSHTKVYVNHWTVNLIAAYDCNRLAHTRTPAEICYYLLTSKTNKGPVGWRADQKGSSQWSSLSNYTRLYTDQNFASFGSSGPFNAIINELWKFAPNVGEPENNGEALPVLVQQVKLYRSMSVGNGNYTKSTTADNNMREAAKLCGHRFEVRKADYSMAGNILTVILDWINVGSTRLYYDFDVIFELLDSAGKVAFSSTSTFEPNGFLPATSITSHKDAITLSGVAAGDYSLRFYVKHAAGFLKNIPLAIQGATGDGIYTIGTVTVGAIVPNQPPVVNAGSDKRIKLPVNSVQLSALASDPDGSIKSVQWKKVSGTGDIVSPASLTTDVTNLQSGTSVFEITAIDNSNASSNDQVTIIVDEADPIPVQKKVVSAAPIVDTLVTYDDGTTEVIKG